MFGCMKSMILVVFPVVLLGRSQVASAEAWPSGSRHEISITGADDNLSGASWNSQLHRLWVVRSKAASESGHSPDGVAWQFEYDAKTGVFVGGNEPIYLPSSAGTDIEACTQVALNNESQLYVMAENQGRIVQFNDLGSEDVTYKYWDLEEQNNGHAMPPENNEGLGAEGLEFVTDEALLAAEFRFPNGDPFTGSQKGMGGLMFVGHQLNGQLWVFDVNPNITDDFVNYGSFNTSADEIAGLHFDRASGLFYIWHNPGSSFWNTLEVTRMTSSTVGTVDSLVIFDTEVPDGNLEGIAIVGQDLCGAYSADEGERLFFFSHDDPGFDGGPPLFYFKHFSCGIECDQSLTAVGIQELLYILQEWGTSDPLADITHDGIVGQADVMLAITLWGTCTIDQY